MTQTLHPTSYTVSLAKSLTIDEMRDLHRRALTEAEAKKTELKLVLASRYRELVGSSDEVLDMQRDAKVLAELVSKIPHLVEELIECANSNEETKNDVSNKLSENDSGGDCYIIDTLQLADAPRVVHSCLDSGDVHGAATSIIQVFALITKHTRQYPLANALSRVAGSETFNPTSNAALQAQVKMIFLHLQSIPLRTIQMSKKILLHLSLDCATTAGALSALHLLNVQHFPPAQRANKLMDLYFDSKAKLIHSLLDYLSPESGDSSPNSARSKKVATYYTEEATDAAEKTISEILLILQYDIILYPYQIFMMRRFSNNSETESVIQNLPVFDSQQLKAKVSNFLAAHLPLIRSKVKTMLVGIAGTTASRLGHMRQSLYDKTDGIECLENLSSGICTWNDAVQLVDVKVVTRALEGLTTTAPSNASNSSMPNQQRIFSLWGTLFSNTFSSLVHSILSTSFHSVHRQVVAALRGSLANAPPFREILPHEAYRNALCIATELDKALKKVSDDAHELLVHAEEREESERRLKQSLYVQTCEIMCRLLNELRRMLEKSSSREYGCDDDEEDATKELIVGRLCFLLKFRLTSLPTLLDPSSSPAVIASKSGGKVGMITILELKSAFDIADIDDDGLVTYEESMEAMEGAFSGTHFHGAEMVRDTMLLSSGSEGVDLNSSGGRFTLTLSELALLSARGLRHKDKGLGSALGIIQTMLDSIVESCFSKWAQVAISPALKKCMNGVEEFKNTASIVTESEWKRLHIMNRISDEDLLQQEIGFALDEGDEDSKASVNGVVEVGSVSSFLTTYFISVTSVLNQSISPADSMQPYPSHSYAAAMGIEMPNAEDTMMKLLRSCLVRESLHSISLSMYRKLIGKQDNDANNKEMRFDDYSASSLTQLLLNLSFIINCYFKRNDKDFDVDKPLPCLKDGDEFPLTIAQQSKELLNTIEEETKEALRSKPGINFKECLSIIEARQDAVFKKCGMFFFSLFGEDKASASSPYEDLDAISALSIPGSKECSLLVPPLASSRRFMLLPIQAEQSVKELQLIKNLEKERSDKAELEKIKSATSAAASAVSSSFGFFSSMLNKKK